MGHCSRQAAYFRGIKDESFCSWGANAQVERQIVNNICKENISFIIFLISEIKIVKKLSWVIDLPKLH